MKTNKQQVLQLVAQNKRTTYLTIKFNFHKCMLLQDFNNLVMQFFEVLFKKIKKFKKKLFGTNTTGKNAR